METILLQPTKKRGAVTANFRNEYSLRKNEKFISEQLYKLSEMILQKSLSLDRRPENYGQEFKNETFEMLPCQWRCSCDAAYNHNVNSHKVDCITEQPNFKCGDVEIRWYKYIGRAMNSNRVVTLNELKKIFKKCMKSLK